MLGRAKELSYMDVSDRALRNPCRGLTHIPRAYRPLPER